jgi:branched-chain amino acid aminotransferase
MVNFNGKLVDDNSILNSLNRGFLYGDAVFETCKVVNNKVLFFEDHYFRLMASMRIIRMNIPMNFTIEFLENQIIQLINRIEKSDAYRIRMTVFRNEGGFYLPDDNSVSYIINAMPIENEEYFIKKRHYEVDLYKDFYVPKQLLSTIKSTNKIINITGSIFAKENELDNCLLLNDDKNVIEALNGNLFMLINNKLVTPPISDGCLNGVMRKQIIELAKKIESIEVVEESISSFELQKADELFVTNVMLGIQPITVFRKKEYVMNFSEKLLNQLNEMIKN